MDKIVPVLRKVTSNREVEAFIQNEQDHLDNESLWSNGNNSRKQAREEMRIAIMETDGDTGYRTMNYTGVSGRGIEDQKTYLLTLSKDYSQWSALMNPRGTSKTFTRSFARGMKIKEIADEYGLHQKKVERLIHLGLDEFSSIRGYGENKRITVPATRPQLELIEAIYTFQRKHGVSPTLDELAEIKSVTKTAIHYMIVRMGNRGLLSYVPARQRSIVLLC